MEYTGNFDKAKEHYEEAISLDAVSTDAMYNLGITIDASKLTGTHPELTSSRSQKTKPYFCGPPVVRKAPCDSPKLGSSHFPSRGHSRPSREFTGLS